MTYAARPWLSDLLIAGVGHPRGQYKGLVNGETCTGMPESHDDTRGHLLTRGQMRSALLRAPAGGGCTGPAGRTATSTAVS
jgi:hypothetical protein